jgi:hypothetical protein
MSVAAYTTGCAPPVMRGQSTNTTYVVAAGCGHCGKCKGDGRDPDHWKNACPVCGGSGRAVAA